ncbi:MAG: hypothetical protein JWM59_1508 [Verrucomicrobiales bacterium]|nr:hypothetical protein [Verrucomicrobiales bacterium]
MRIPHLFSERAVRQVLVIPRRNRHLLMSLSNQVNSFKMLLYPDAQGPGGLIFLENPVGPGCISPFPALGECSKKIHPQAPPRPVPNVVLSSQIF